MAKKLTTVVNFVLDETGSMEIVKQATISGFNEYLTTLRQQPGKVLLTLTKFNSGKIETLYRAAPIADVKDLDADTYRPSNGTPLYDAVAQTIHETEKALTGMKGKPNVLCIIMTDGEENSSKEYSREKLFALIKAKESEGWTFAYLGANRDAWEVGASIGVPMASVASYNANAPDAGLKRLAVQTTSYFSRSAIPGAAPAASVGFFADEPDANVVDVPITNS